jgi:xanthine dehydrogenase accessory factor
MDLFDGLESYLNQGKNAAVATVVSKTGAAPREVGAKMLIGSDGRFLGTIGGGCVDAEASLQARMVMQEGVPMLLRYSMNGNVAEEEGMICGGTVEILVEPVLSQHLTVWRQTGELMKESTDAILLTRYGTETFTKTLFKRDGTHSGDFADLSREKLDEYFNAKKLVVEKGFLVEPLARPEVLYVFGAGHISQFVAKMASLVDFGVVIIDDRWSFANKERFPEAEEVLVEDFVDVVGRLSFTGAEYAVIVTRGHKHDATVLEKVLEKPAKYVGMIGSKRKTKLVFDHLRARGVLGETLAQVHAPIGLDIGSETPQEIAISIVAQLVQARRRAGSGKALPILKAD